jgi:hypothetical protein
MYMQATEKVFDMQKTGAYEVLKPKHSLNSRKVAKSI